MLTPITITRLEKAATDNGFDLDLGRAADWLCFGSSQTSMRTWLTAVGESLFLVAASRSDVLEALAGLGVVFTSPLPNGAAGARSVSEIAALHRLLRRAFQLSRTLPDALLRAFESETANLPRSTEAEGLVVQRVGQDVFRRGLLDYWPIVSATPSASTCSTACSSARTSTPRSTPVSSPSPKTAPWSFRMFCLPMPGCSSGWTAL